MRHLCRTCAPVRPSPILTRRFDRSLGIGQGQLHSQAHFSPRAQPCLSCEALCRPRRGSASALWTWVHLAQGSALPSLTMVQPSCSSAGQAHHLATRRTAARCSTRAGRQVARAHQQTLVLPVHWPFHALSVPYHVCGCRKPVAWGWNASAQYAQLSADQRSQHSFIEDFKLALQDAAKAAEIQAKGLTPELVRAEQTGQV